VTRCAHGGSFDARWRGAVSAYNRAFRNRAGAPQRDVRLCRAV